MKKIALALISLSISYATVAQNEMKEKPKDTKNQSDDSKATASLEGKAFKITLTQKSAGTKVTGTNDKIKTDPAAPSMDNATKTETATGEVATEQLSNDAEISATEERQSAFAELANAKARLKFEGENIKISFTKENLNVETCTYRITSGTAKFATFSANCGTRMSSTPVHDNGTVLPQTGTDQTGISTEITGTPDTGVPATATDPATTTTTTAPAGTIDADAQTKEMPVTTQSAPMTTSYVTATITGLVNGNEISGTVIFNDSGKRVSYSYAGVIDTKKEKKSDDLGLNK